MPQLARQFPKVQSSRSKKSAENIKSFYPITNNYMLSRVIPYEQINTYILRKISCTVISSEPIKLTLAFSLKWGKHYSFFQTQCISTRFDDLSAKIIKWTNKWNTQGQFQSVMCHATRFVCYPSTGNFKMHSWACLPSYKPPRMCHNTCRYCFSK